MRKIRYTVNGKEYESLEQIPTKERELFTDKNDNGIPDIIDNAQSDNRIITISHQKIIIDGKEYGSWEEVPPEYSSLKNIFENPDQKKSNTSRTVLQNNNHEEKSFWFKSPKQITLTILILVVLPIGIIINAWNDSTLDRYTVKNIGCTVRDFYDYVLRESSDVGSQKNCMLETAALASQKDRARGYDLCLQATHKNTGYCTTLYGTNSKNIPIGECETLFLTSTSTPSFWYNKISTLLPQWRVYDLGSYCKLDTIQSVVTYTAVPYNKKIRETISGVMFFEGNVHRRNLDLDCLTAGDIPTPIVESVRKNTIDVYCKGADAGEFFEQKFVINLTTFQIENQNSLPRETTQ